MYFSYFHFLHITLPKTRMLICLGFIATKPSFNLRQEDGIMNCILLKKIVNRPWNIHVEDEVTRHSCVHLSFPPQLQTSNRSHLLYIQMGLNSSNFSFPSNYSSQAEPLSAHTGATMIPTTPTLPFCVLQTSSPPGNQGDLWKHKSVTVLLTLWLSSKPSLWSSSVPTAPSSYPTHSRQKCSPFGVFK